jgi:hypothetical protein
LYYTPSFVQREQTTTEELVGFRHSRQRMTGRTGRLAKRSNFTFLYFSFTAFNLHWSTMLLFNQMVVRVACPYHQRDDLVKPRQVESHRVSSHAYRSSLQYPDYQLIPQEKDSPMPRRETTNSLMLGDRVRVGVTSNPTSHLSNKINKSHQQVIGLVPTDMLLQRTSLILSVFVGCSLYARLTGRRIDRDLVWCMIKSNDEQTRGGSNMFK